jgi:hypothetical protein
MPPSGEWPWAIATQPTGFAVLTSSPSPPIVSPRDARAHAHDAKAPEPELPTAPVGPMGVALAALSAAGSSSAPLYLMLVAAISLAALFCRTSLVAAAARKPVAFVWLLERPG